MPTEVFRYVNTNSTAGGDGTTNGTAGATRAYASLSESFSKISRAYPSFITADVIVRVVCEGGLDNLPYDTSNTVASAVTSSATHYLQFEASASQEATAAKFDTSKYHFLPTNPLPVSLIQPAALRTNSNALIGGIRFKNLQMGVIHNDAIVDFPYFYIGSVYNSLGKGSGSWFDGCRILVSMSNSAPAASGQVFSADVRLFNCIVQVTGPSQSRMSIIEGGTFNDGLIYQNLFVGGRTLYTSGLGNSGGVFRNNVAFRQSVTGTEWVNKISTGSFGNVTDQGPLSSSTLAQQWQLNTVYANPQLGNFTVVLDGASVILRTAGRLDTASVNELPLSHSMNGQIRASQRWDVGPNQSGVRTSFS